MKEVQPWMGRTELLLGPDKLKKLVNSQYEDCINEQYKYGCVGKIQTKKCTTEKGVLGGDYSEKKYGGDSNWSIVNKFLGSFVFSCVFFQIRVSNFENK